MKALIWTLMLALAAGSRLPAADSDDATVRDLQRLQRELDNLDGDLQALEKTSPSAARSLSDRADDIRQRTVALKDQMDRSSSRDAASTGVSKAEVEDLRRDVRRLQADIERSTDATTPGRSDGSGTISVPEGTEITLRLEQSLSSASARPEDRVKAIVLQPVRVDGVTVIPAETEVRGVVREVEPAERLRRGGRLGLDFDTLTLNSQRIDIRTKVVSMQDQDAAGQTARKAGMAAIIGGAVGGLLKGRTGVLVGAMAGGGVVMAQKGEDVELPEGTVLKAKLDRPVAVPRESR